MSKSSGSLVIAAIILAGAGLASALITDPGDSWLEFVAWIGFYAAIQTPLFVATKYSAGNCTAWFSRFVRKE